MSVEERIARLEARSDSQDKWLQSIDGKVDQLVAAANMGKGAWLLLLKMGGLMTAIAALVAWVIEKFPHRTP